MPGKPRTIARSWIPLTISIVTPFLKFGFNFESQLEIPPCRISLPSSLSIPVLPPLNEAVSRTPRKTLWKSTRAKVPYLTGLSTHKLSDRVMGDNPFKTKYLCDSD